MRREITLQYAVLKAGRYALLACAMFMVTALQAEICQLTNDNVSTKQNEPVTFNVLANDVFPFGFIPNPSTLKIIASSITDPAISINDFVIGDAGYITFTPPLDYFGQFMFYYQVTGSAPQVHKFGEPDHKVKWKLGQAKVTMSVCPPPSITCCYGELLEGETIPREVLIVEPPQFKIGAEFCEQPPFQFFIKVRHPDNPPYLECPCTYIVRVVDNFPAEFQDVFWTRTGIGPYPLDGEGNICDTFEIGPGQEVIYQVCATIDPAADPNKKLFNVASLSDPDNGFGGTLIDCCQLPFCLERCSSVTCNKTVSRDGIRFVENLEAYPCSPIIYRLAVTNNGPSDAECVHVFDEFPEEVENLSWSATAEGARADEAIFNPGPEVDITVIDEKIDYLPAGVSIVYIITGKLDANLGLEDDPIVNTAKVTHDDVCEECQATIHLRIPPAEICVCKTADSECFFPGGKASWTVVVSNCSDEYVHGISVTDVIRVADDVIPNPILGCVYKRLFCDCTELCDYEHFDCEGVDGLLCIVDEVIEIECCCDGFVDCIDVLPPHTCAVYTLCGTVSVLADVSDKPLIENEVWVHYANNKCCKDTHVKTRTPLKRPTCVKVHKEITSDDDCLIAGDEIEFTIVVSNEGDFDAANVRLVDNFSGLLENIVWSGTVNNNPPFVLHGVGDIDIFFDLDAGANAIFTVIARVKNDAQGTLENTAEVVYENNTCPCDASSSVEKKITPRANIRVKKRSHPNPFKPGGDATYIITVKNEGPGKAWDILVKDPLPEKFIFEDASCEVFGQGACKSIEEKHGEVIAKLDLAAGSFAEITIEGKIAKDAKGEVVNTVWASLKCDPDKFDDHAEDRVEVKPLDLKLSLMFDPEQPCCDEKQKLTIMVKNPCPDTDATNVMVTGFLPLGLEYVPGSAQGDGIFLPELRKWQVGTLKGGEKKTLIIKVVFNKFAEGKTIHGVAKVTYHEQASVSPNNLAIFWLDVPKCKEHWEED